MKIKFDTPPASAQSDQGLAVRYAASRRRVSQWRWYLLVAIVLSLPAYFALRFLSDIFIVRAPGFVLMEQISVKAGVQGVVTKCLPQGALVHAGEPIIWVAPAHQPVAPVPQTAKPVTNEPDHKQLADAEKVVRLAQLVMRIRKNRLNMVQSLVDQGAATQADLANAQSQWIASVGQFNQANMDFDVLRQRKSRLAMQPPASAPTVPPVPIAAALSPADGVLIEQFTLPNTWVERDSDIAVVRSKASAWIRAYVSPSNLKDCVPGTKATLLFDDGGRLPAYVSRVEPEAQKLPPDRVSPFEARNQSIVVDLVPTEPLPQRYDVYYLPLEVRFPIRIDLAPVRNRP